jgi:hypothetical protein
MGLRDRLRKAESRSGITRVRCEECGQRWAGDAMLEAEYLAGAWVQALGSEAFVEAASGDMEALAAQPLKRHPNTPDVVWALLSHPHDGLVVESTGKPLCHDLMQAWGA